MHNENSEITRRSSLIVGVTRRTDCAMEQDEPSPSL